MKKVIWAVVSLIIAIFTVMAVVSQSKSLSPADLLRALGDAKKLWLVLAVLLAAGFVWFEGTALRSILRSTGYKTKRSSAFLYSASDIYFSAITPSATGGQPASAFFMMRDGLPVGVTTAVLVLNLMMYTLAIVFMGLISIILCPGAFVDFGSVSKVLIIIGFVGLIFLSLLFLSILKRGEKVFILIAKFLRFLHRKKIIKNLDAKLSKLETMMHDYESCSEIIAGRKSVMLKAFFWNVVQRASQMAVPAVIYIALHGQGRFGFTVFAKQCLITIGFNFLPIPGGMGISDYMMVDGFTGIMGEDMAFQIEMLSRGITFYICVSICAVITLIGYLVGRKNQNA